MSCDLDEAEGAFITDSAGESLVRKSLQCLLLLLGCRWRLHERSCVASSVWMAVRECCVLSCCFGLWHSEVEAIVSTQLMEACGYLGSRAPPA